MNIRDLTNQNAMQFGNTETEKGPGRERRHECRKNKSYGCERDHSPEAEQCKSFKLCFSWYQLYIIKWQHSERQGKL